MNKGLWKPLATMVAGGALAASVGATASPTDDQRTVAALDIAYQAAVKQGDVATMAHILHDEFALVRGDGRVVTREQIIDGARSGAYAYEQQDEIPGKPFAAHERSVRARHAPRGRFPSAMPASGAARGR